MTDMKLPPYEIQHIVHVVVGYKGKRRSQLTQAQRTSQWNEEDSLWHWESWNTNKVTWEKGALSNYIIKTWWPIPRLNYLRWWIETETLAPLEETP